MKGQTALNNIAPNKEPKKWAGMITPNLFGLNRPTNIVNHWIILIPWKNKPNNASASRTGNNGTFSDKNGTKLLIIFQNYALESETKKVINDRFTWMIYGNANMKPKGVKNDNLTIINNERMNKLINIQRATLIHSFPNKIIIFLPNKFQNESKSNAIFVEADCSDYRFRNINKPVNKY